MMGAEDLTEDAVLGGRLRLRQPRTGHRAGTDAIIVAAMVPALAGQHVVDFGAGVGTAGLAVLARVPGARATLVEIDPGFAALARDNAAANGLAAQVISGDVADLSRAGSELLANAIDHVLGNPPYNAADGRAPPDARTARARVAPPDLLDLWLRAAARLLRPAGTLSLIHRPEALGDILAALSGRFGGVALRFVHPMADRPANRLLVQGTKASRAPLRVLPPLVLNTAKGVFTPEAEALHRDLAPLPMSST
jgi:tRNA1(Val) A37 N6-methylase TrmN6